MPSETGTPIANDDLNAKPVHLATDRQLGRWLVSWQTVVVAFWVVGVALMAIRLSAQWVAVRRLVLSAAVFPAASPWNARLRRLTQSMGIRRNVRLLSSASIRVPVAVGIVRPIIIVPLSMLTDLTVSQVEAILLHELAHIRRHDYLVNLGQAVMEVLFFYHPVVWWISRQMRAERENSCDDLAIAACGSVTEYVHSLAALEEHRSHGVPGLATAATGAGAGSLLKRVRRLVEPERRLPARPVLVPFVVFALALVLGSYWLAAEGQQGGSAGPDWPNLRGSTYELEGTSVYVVHDDQQIVSAVIIQHPDKRASHSVRGGATRKASPFSSYVYDHEEKWDEAAIRVELDQDDYPTLRALALTRSQGQKLHRLSLEEGRIVYWDADSGAISQHKRLNRKLPPPQNLTGELAATIRSVVERLNSEFAPKGDTDPSHLAADHRHEHAPATDQALMREILGRANPELWKVVDVPQMVAEKQISLSPDQQCLALFHGGHLQIMEAASGHGQSYRVDHPASVGWRSGSVHLVTETGANRFYQMRRPQIQFVDNEGKPIGAEAIVEARIGFRQRTPQWSTYGTRNEPLSLVGLKPGTHWLVVAPWQQVIATSVPLGTNDLNLESDVVLAGELTTETTPSGAVRRISCPRRPFPQPRGRDIFARGTATASTNGPPTLRIEVQNNSGERLQFSERDIYLTSELDGVGHTVLSPQWTRRPAPNQPPLLSVENGQSGSFELNWNNWAQRGLWVPNAAWDRGGPTLGEAPAGHVMVRLQGPGFGALPVAVPLPQFPVTQTPARSVDDTGTAAQEDDISVSLYRRYVLAGGKISTTQVDAAIEIVAARSRNDESFEQQFLTDFVDSCRDGATHPPRRNMLKLAAKILEYQGAARWQHQLANETG
ncbi:MAG: M56 family metallopeptidase, partial [Planctomycetales bacterium]|nr:M56 family metallopeptidase [Planctomycetales bacterium]